MNRSGEGKPRDKSHGPKNSNYMSLHGVDEHPKAVQTNRHPCSLNYNVQIVIRCLCRIRCLNTSFLVASYACLTGFISRNLGGREICGILFYPFPGDPDPTIRWIIVLEESITKGKKGVDCLQTGIDQGSINDYRRLSTCPILSELTQNHCRPEQFQNL